MKRNKAGKTSSDRLGWAALGAVFLLAAVLSTRQLGSLDVGFHLAVGERVLRGEGWPQTDPFTFTVPDHRYVDPSWGYQVVVATLGRVGGAPALVLFHGGLVLALCALVVACARLGRVSALVLSPLLMLGVLSSEMRFESRPELVSYGLLALVLYLLRRRAEGGRVWLGLFPLIFVIWANLHSLFVLGWVAIGAFLVGSAIRDRRLDRGLVGAGLAAAVATLLNPYGLDAALFPLTLATRLDPGNLFGESIGEFVSPFALRLNEAFPFYPRLPVWSFRALFVMALAVMPWLIAKRRWAQALVALPFLYLSARMVRNMPLLLVATLPGIADSLSLWLQARLHRVGRAILAAAVIVGSLAIATRVVNDAHYIDSRRSARFGLDWNRSVLPIEVAEWARRTHPPGRMLNHLNFGGYFIHALGEPVFIDGRLELIGEEFYATYRRIMSDPAAFDAAVARWQIGWIAFPHRTQGQLVSRLVRDPRWRLAWVDPVAVAFVRESPDAALYVDPRVAELRRAAPAPLGLDGLPGLGATARPGRADRWLAGFARRQVFPDESFGLGLFHLFSGDSANAAASFATAVRQSHGVYYETYANLGAALWRLDRQSEAAACYRVVLEDDPENRIARERAVGPAAR